MTATATRESRFVSAGGNTDGGKSGPGSKDAKGEAPAKPSKFKSKKFLIIVVAVLALGAGGYMFLKPTKTPPPSGGDVVAMDATTLNLAGGHYLKIAVAIQLVKGAASATGFSSSHAAELVIDEFSNRTVVSLGSNAARKKLTADLLADIKKAYPGEVFDLFVTNFVTQ
jgi:flagellar FliL protein